MTTRFSRRALLKSGSAAAALSVLDRHPHAQAVTGLHRSAMKLGHFDYSQVKLLEGPMREQFRANHAFLLALNEDLLLKPFRQLPAFQRPAKTWAAGIAGRTSSIRRIT